MILPLMGFVGKLKRSVIGMSSEKGFLLQISTSDAIAEIKNPITRNPIFFTRNFNEGDFFSKINPLTLGLMSAISISLTFAFSLINFFAHFNLQDHFIFIIILSILNGLIVPILSFSFFLDAIYWIYGLIILFLDKDLREWHACEHKSAVLIEAGLEPTVENLKKMPTTLLSCGASICGTQIGAHTSLIMLFLSYSLIPSNILTLIIILLPAIILSYCGFTFILDFRHKKLNYCLLTIIALPIMAVPLITEKLFTLKEPSEEKYRETAEELKNFIENYQIY